ncbi:ribosomal protein S18 acetylase RimI-like enzyme [Alkalibaculum bacchi]|uniref:Ribosomal protein S18 acetylase RimI-like enzyme n=1 Tax=Alkalibaculum bacchi TaxID=645887 RepID=A0A366IG45_9FIRM|nr:GNAT family N-acetyltransferase [Alkalibaculum bacchi]RBP69096.1 ribosomal protein S18 acetylase RimI-like enzyme [Alkalibaculum bacchi]
MLSENFECIPLEWDTDYFKVNSARVNLKGIVNKEDQKEIIDFCKHYDFVTISNLDNIKDNNQWIGERTNAFLVDVNIQFLKDLYGNNDIQIDNTYVTNKLPRNEQVINIARNSFRYSRFFNDPNLLEVKAKKIYIHWTECAFESENKYFVLHKKDKNIAGYILFSINEDNCVIELIAVDEKYQGQRIGKSLIRKMESFVIDKGIRKIKVGTQIENISAAQFYSKMGFVYVSCGSIYHLWPNQ